MRIRGDKAAEQKMKEANARLRPNHQQKKNYTGGTQGQNQGPVWRARVRMGKGTGSSGPFGGGFDPFGFGGWGRTGQNAGANESPHMRAAYQYISSGSYAEAMRVLSGIHERGRPVVLLQRPGKTRGLETGPRALGNARQAVAMDPNNLEYRRLLDQLEGAGARL